MKIKARLWSSLGKVDATDFARKGERAGQGKGEGGEKGKERNQWLLIFYTKVV